MGGQVWTGGGSQGRRRGQRGTSCSAERVLGNHCDQLSQGALAGSPACRSVPPGSVSSTSDGIGIDHQLVTRRGALLEGADTQLHFTGWRSPGHLVGCKRCVRSKAAAIPRQGALT